MAIETITGTSGMSSVRTNDNISPDNIALFDLDGTLANYDESMRYWLWRIAGPNEQLFDHHDHNLPDWAFARVKMIRNQPGWWENLKPLEPGFELLRLAQRIGFQTSVLTKGPNSSPAAWTEKFRWCKQHLTEDVQVTITQDKSLTYGRVLVDDFPEYVIPWLNNHKRGLAIMPAFPMNAGAEHERLIRYDGNNMAQVERAMQLAYARKPGEIVNFKG